MPNVKFPSLTGASVGDGRVMGPPLGWQVLLGEHVWPLGQLPQLSVPPQPSGMLPQLLAEQTWGVQVLVTHTLLMQVALVWQVPLTHDSPTGQPQVMVPPQPSDTGPQAAPTPPEPQVLGTHAGWQVPL